MVTKIVEKKALTKEPKPLFEDALIDKSIEENGEYLLSILRDVQDYYNYLPENALRKVAEKLKLPLINVYSVATFYQSFSLTPKGEHQITVCLGTACYVRGGTKIAETLARELNIKYGETTKDNKFTLETVNCLGCCAIGPTLVVDGKYYGEMSAQKAVTLLRDLKE